MSWPFSPLTHLVLFFFFFRILVSGKAEEERMKELKKRCQEMEAPRARPSSGPEGPGGAPYNVSFPLSCFAG